MRVRDSKFLSFVFFLSIKASLKLVSEIVCNIYAMAMSYNIKVNFPYNIKLRWSY